MDPLFDILITKLRDRFVWCVVACYYAPAGGGDPLPDVYHGPFDYPGAIQRKEDIEAGTYGGYKQAKIVLDLMELG